MHFPLNSAGKLTSRDLCTQSDFLSTFSEKMNKNLILLHFLKRLFDDFYTDLNDCLIILHFMRNRTLEVKVAASYVVSSPT